ncbi:hypothetical protein IWQ57_004510, partial [Coemansia nantahalensis]
MKFAKVVETNSKELPEEWRPYVIRYKLLKKNIKRIVQELDATFQRLHIEQPVIGTGEALPATDADSSATAPDGAVVQVHASAPAGVAYSIESATEDTGTQVVVRLEADQLFFDQLVEYIRRIEQFGQRYTRSYCANVDHMSTSLAAVASPYKHDYHIWREIFRLYMDAEVWCHSEGDYRPQSTSREGQRRFGDFVKHIEAVRLAQQFEDPLSAQLLMSFYKLNMELIHMRLLQETNEQAARKIIKKHDKQTHLTAMAQFPHLLTVDTASLTQALVQTIYDTFVSI